MGRISESVEIAASAVALWDYVQDFRRRTEWDTTVSHFEPIGADAPGTGVTVRIRSTGFPAVEYEAVYVSFEPYTVSAIKLTRPLRNVIFTSAAGSWRYRQIGADTTEFTVTFDYDVGGGAFGRLFDRALLGPMLRRGTRKSLRKLRAHFAQPT